MVRGLDVFKEYFNDYQDGYVIIGGTACDMQIRGKGVEQKKYYRFMKPGNHAFPYQVELFSGNPDLVDLEEGIHLTPIPTPDDLSSLSAILLDDVYYHFVIEHSKSVNGLHWANTEALICLKAKAYLDISDRIARGSKEDKRHLKKHKGDVFRLVVMLAESDVYDLPAEVARDLERFLDSINDDLPDKGIFREMGLTGVEPDAVLSQIGGSLLSK